MGSIEAMVCLGGRLRKMHVQLQDTDRTDFEEITRLRGLIWRWQAYIAFLSVAELLRADKVDEAEAKLMRIWTDPPVSATEPLATENRYRAPQ